jgi:hypothetical protein
MHFQIEHKNGIDEIGNLTEKIAQNYGTTTRHIWGRRFGAIDIESLIEIGVCWAFFEIVKNYGKGLIGIDWFKNLEEEHRKKLLHEISIIKSFIKEYYNQFIKNNKMEESISLIEKFNDITIFVSLNDTRLIPKLIDHLGNALCELYAKLDLGIIDLKEAKTVQLYPNFNTETWDFIFAPSNAGFGKFIDRYYDLRINTLINVNSTGQSRLK